jgi:hypothetical protein
MARRLVDGCCENFAREVVSSLRQRDGELTSRPPVELRGTSGSGTRAASEPAVLDLEQTFLDEPVQMKLHRMQRDAHVVGGLLAADSGGGADDVSVQGEPRGLGERADAAHLRAEVLVLHHSPSWRSTLTCPTLLTATEYPVRDEGESPCVSVSCSLPAQRTRPISPRPS